VFTGRGKTQGDMGKGGLGGGKQKGRLMRRAKRKQKKRKWKERKKGLLNKFDLKTSMNKKTILILTYTKWMKICS
jgi:hypothetical protein